MEERYGLENLSKVFDGHAKAQMRMHNEQMLKFKEAYPDERLPDHFKDDFCLPMALKSLVDEIIKLRKDS